MASPVFDMAPLTIRSVPFSWGFPLCAGHIFWQDMVHDPKGNMISEMGPAMALPVFFTFHVLCASFFALLGDSSTLKLL